MNPVPAHKKFIFNEKLDAEFLFNLYEDDFPYIEEVFTITLSQLDPDLDQVALAFRERELLALRKAVHKIKPSFGFVGLIPTQEACRAFEESCDQATSFDSISEAYSELWTLLGRSRDIISMELDRLKKFNSTV